MKFHVVVGATSNHANATPALIYLGPSADAAKAAMDADTEYPVHFLTLRANYQAIRKQNRNFIGNIKPPEPVQEAPTPLPEVPSADPETTVVATKGIGRGRWGKR